MMNDELKSERSSTTGPEDGGGTLLAWLQLVRLPNLFTAMADSAMGVLFVQAVVGPDDFRLLGLLMGASAALYAGGVALNDVFDLDIDLRERPARPIPSGRIAPEAARALGLGLLAMGLAAAWLAAFFAGQNAVGLVACVLAALVVAYNALIKRTPLGPAAMGGCRMLNVLLGMSVAAGPWGAAEWLVAAAIGVYVAGVTWFARTEAQESDHRQLALATVVMVAGLAILGCLPLYIEPKRLVRLLQIEPARWYIFITALGLWIGWRGLRALLTPTPQRVQLAVRQCILSLIFLDAAAVFAVRDLGWAVAVLALLLPTTLLGRWVYST